MPDIFSSLGISETDLAEARRLAAAHIQAFGEKYRRYVGKVGAVLLEVYPQAQTFSPAELVDLITVTDVISPDSRGIMKRMKSACTGCGWCCSKTKNIVVDEEDAVRISRKLKQKQKDLFVFDGKDWKIKKVNPCGWWNPRNGHCMIYNDRPSTCRVWPLGVNVAGQNTIQPVEHCNYAVMVLVSKVLWILQSAGQQPLTPPGSSQTG